MTNQTILYGLKKRLDQAKEVWADEISGLLWSYHTTNQSPTRETFFMLTFGIKVIILIEVGIPSPKTQAFNKEQNPQDIRPSLDLIEEARTDAKLRSFIHNQKADH